MSIRRYREEDRDAVYPLRRVAFAGPRISPQWTVDPGGWYGFVAEDDDELVGFTRVHGFGQFFGGRAVPMGGIGSVAVAPHARGRGLATRLLTEAVAAMREHGQPISALFASVPPLYRTAGWEHCGVRQTVVVAPEFLAAVERSRTALRTARQSDVDTMRARYLELAAGVDGMLDRAGVQFPPGEPLTADVCEVAEDRGYLTARRDTVHTLEVRDLVAADVDAARALVGSLATWAGQVREVVLPVVDPALHDLVIGWPEHHELRTHAWMLRVVDLAAAVAARGWPAAATLPPATVDIAVTDDLAPWNAGNHRLTVDGTVGIAAGGDGTVAFTARGLAAWYAGSAPLAALRRAGQVSGPCEADPLLDTLTRGAVRPRMGDEF